MPSPARYPLALPATLTLGISAALLSLAAHAAPAADILIVTDHQHPVQAVSPARLIELDAPARLEAALAANLPADPAQAAAQVQERLRAGGAALQRQLAAAYQGVVDAWGLGITKLPAVVVDQRYVVYGEPDAAQALARIAAFRAKQP